jgi:hypothetical protein
MNHVDPSISSGSSPGARIAQDEPGNVLTVVQKYLLRVVLGQAGKTVLYRERLVEVVAERDLLRQLMPLVESDLSEGNSTQVFWAPRRPADRKRFNLARRDRSRNHLAALGVALSDSRPMHARRKPLHSRFPSPSFVRHLVTELGYDGDAALAVFARSKGWLGTSDRRRKKVVGGADQQAERRNHSEYQRIDYGDNAYVSPPSRCTLTGGGFTEEQIQQGLSKMRTDRGMKTALIDVVYRRQSPQVVAAKFGMPRAKLDVYASRLRERIRRESQPKAA